MTRQTLRITRQGRRDSWAIGPYWQANAWLSWIGWKAAPWGFTYVLTPSSCR